MVNINLSKPKGLVLSSIYIISSIIYILCISIKFNFIGVSLKYFNIIVLISIISFALSLLLKFIIYFDKDIHAQYHNPYNTLPLLINQPIIVTLLILIMITIFAIKIISIDTVWVLLQDFLDITDNTLTILLNVSKGAVFLNAIIELFIIVFSLITIVYIIYNYIYFYLMLWFNSNKDKIKKQFTSKANEALNKMKITVQKTVHLRILLDITQHKHIIKKLFNNHITIFDIRTPFEIRNGHVCNAILLYDFVNDYKNILKYKILDLIKKNKKDIVIYDSNGKRSIEIAELLHSNGFENKIYIIQNGGFNDLGVLLEPNQICKLCR